jgi:hypothetical protein
MEIHMKTVFLAASLGLSMTAFPALAADEHGAQDDGPEAEASTAATAKSSLSTTRPAR